MLSVTPTKNFFVQSQKSSYCNGPKFSDRQDLANSVDPDHEQSDQDLHCLPFRPHLLNILYSMVKPHCSNFRMITAIFWDAQIFRIFMVKSLQGDTAVQ